MRNVQYVDITFPTSLEKGEPLYWGRLSILHTTSLITFSHRELIRQWQRPYIIERASGSEKYCMLFVVVHNTRIIVIVTFNASVVHKWIWFALYLSRYHLNQLVVGLGVQWVPDFIRGEDHPTTTLQLSLKPSTKLKGRQTVSWRVVWHRPQPPVDVMIALSLLCNHHYKGQLNTTKSGSTSKDYKNPIERGHCELDDLSLSLSKCFHYS